MIRRWFDTTGAIGRQRFFIDTCMTWLIGNLGFLVYFLVETQIHSFAAYGRLIDHRFEAVEGMERVMGSAWTFIALTLWLLQVWALAALSAKRLQDLGQDRWLAWLSLVPGVQIVFWLVLCLRPAKIAARDPEGASALS